jgi:hypothetical protein
VARGSMADSRGSKVEGSLEEEQQCLCVRGGRGSKWGGKRVARGSMADIRGSKVEGSLW